MCQPRGEIKCFLLSLLQNLVKMFVLMCAEGFDIDSTPVLTFFTVFFVVTSSEMNFK